MKRPRAIALVTLGGAVAASLGLAPASPPGRGDTAPHAAPAAPSGPGARATSDLLRAASVGPAPALPSGPAPAARAAGCPASGGAGVARAAVPDAEVVFSGHGWGHGMGMSQYGAQGAARLGCGYRTILATYYRNTRLKTVPMNAPVHLSLLGGAGRATVLAETGSVRWTGDAVQPRGATWQVVRRGGGVAVRDATRERAWVPDGETLSASHSGTVVRVRAYRPGATWPSSDLRTRWDQARFTPSGGRFDVTQVITGSGGHTAVQKYLWGLAEVPSSWPQEALRAQVVAARTYLLSKAIAGAYRLRTTTADQVYRGWAKESVDTGGAWRQAVTATEGQVLVDSGGRPITAMYSSSMGGYTEDRQYVYGRYGISYLKAVDDSRWDRASDNPYRSWSVGMSRAQLASRLGFSSVSSVTIAPRGSSGRLAGLKVVGVRGGRASTATFTGSAVRYRLRLRSPGFVLGSGSGGGAAPAPPVHPSPTPTPTPSAPVQPLVGDWNGDGRSDAGWYAGGLVKVRAGGKVTSFRYGTRGDVAIAGDWDGDGKDGIAVFRSGRWYLRNALTTGAAEREVSYGRAGDLPVAGRWAGGPADGIGVVRGDAWHLRFTATSGTGERSFVWSGGGAARPLTGDWNGDGTDDPGRHAARRFTLAVTAGTAKGVVPAPAVLAAPRFGADADLPVTGDWDGDGKHTPGVARAAAFVWRDDLSGGKGTGSVPFAR